MSGEPGVGKTSLAAHAARVAHGEGVTVLFGACPEGTSAPYQPWISALSHLVRHCPAEAPSRLSAVHAGALRRLLPGEAASYRRERRSRETPRPSSTCSGRSAPPSSSFQLSRVRSSQLSMTCTGRTRPVWRCCATSSLRRPSCRWRSWRPTVTAICRRRIPSPDCLPICTVSPRSAGWPSADSVTPRSSSSSSPPAGYELDETGVALAHALRRGTGGNPVLRR